MYCKVSTQYKLIFGALTLMVGRQEEHLACKIEWWGVGVLICLQQGTDCLHNGPAAATASQSSAFVALANLRYINANNNNNNNNAPIISWLI